MNARKAGVTGHVSRPVGNKAIAKRTKKVSFVRTVNHKMTAADPMLAPTTAGFASKVF